MAKKKATKKKAVKKTRDAKRKAAEEELELLNRIEELEQENQRYADALENQKEKLMEQRAEIERLKGNNITTRFAFNYPLLEDSIPSRRRIDLPVNFERRKKLFSLLEGMRPEGVKVSKHRNDTQYVVERIGDVVLYLIDCVELTGKPVEPSKPKIEPESSPETTVPESMQVE